MEENNTRRMARHAEVDGLKMLFHNWEHDRFQQLWHRVFDSIQQATGLDTATLNRHLKPKVVRHHNSSKGSLYAIQAYGPAARAYQSLPFALADCLTEMHVKVYAVLATPDAHEWLVDALYHGIQHSNVQLNFFGNKGTRKEKVKGDGKGARLGSRKSDKHAVVYKRRGERPGIEARITDRTLKRCVKETRDYIATIGEEVPDSAAWRLLRAKVGVVGYAYFLDTARGMGVVLTDYVEGVSPDASTDSPRVEWLDAEEENSYRVTE